MANWCDTMYVVTGNEKDIKDFHRALREIHNDFNMAKAGFNGLWLGNILEYFGLNWKDYNCKGCIYYTEPKYWKEGSLYKLHFATETVWVPMNKVFDAIFEKHYPSLRYYYRTEEAGLGLFATNDKEGKYFPEKFILDVSGEDKNGDPVELYEYYESLADLLEDVKQISDKDFKTLEEIGEYFNCLNEKSMNDNSCYYYSIRKFEVVC